MTHTALVRTYRVLAGAAMGCAPFGILHPAFAAAGLVLAVPALLVFSRAYPGELRRQLARDAAPYAADRRFNPATGLPMIGAFDSAGNMFGYGSPQTGNNPLTSYPMTGAANAQGTATSERMSDSARQFNPANGLPMLGEYDTRGNMWGYRTRD